MSLACARDDRHGTALTGKMPNRRKGKGIARPRLVSKHPAYTACPPSFARRKPALPQVTCRFALAQSCAVLHPRLSPSSTHRRKRKNTLQRQASAKVQLRSPASDVAHKPCAPDRAKRRNADE